MKNVPKLRFKGFSGEWQAKKLGDVFDVTSGTTPSRSVNEFFHNGQHHWIKTTDLNNGHVTDTQDKVTDLALKKTSLKLLPEGTVLVAMYGGFNQIGRTGLLTRKAAINQALSALLPKIDVANPYYLLSYLNFHVEDWKTFAASSRKDPNITKNDVLNFEFSYPILAEQTKIADFLTAIDDRISQLSQKCDGLVQYKKGVMQKIFSQELRFKDEQGRAFLAWDAMELNRIGSNFNGLTGKSGDDFGDGESYITYKQIFSDRIVDIAKFSKVKVNEGEKQNKVKYGDIFFTVSSETPEEVGFHSVLLSEVENVYLNSFCFGFRIKSFDIFDPIFAYYIFGSAEFRREVIKLAQGSTRYNISKNAFMEIKVKMPSIAEQEKIAGFLGAVDEKISQAQAQLEALKQYKQGLLQQMFV